MMTIAPNGHQEAVIKAAIQVGLIQSAEDALDLGVRQLLDRLSSPSGDSAAGGFAESQMKQSMFGDIPIFSAGKPCRSRLSGRRWTRFEWNATNC